MKANILILSLVSFSNICFAQDFTEAKAFEEEASPPDGKRESGHKFKWTSGANLIENKNVVGQNDGKTSIYSLQINYDLLKMDEGTEWDTKVSLNETLTKTPGFDRFSKTDDSFSVLSMYKNYLNSIPWLGAFARFELQTPLMDGFDNQSSDVTYIVARKNGSADTIVADRLKLNDGFKPLVTKESVGAVAKALNTKANQLEFRGGLGAKQIQAEGQLLVKDDDTTPTIEVVELENVTLAGLEVGLEWSGSIMKLDYRLFGEALYPLTYSPKNDSDPSESELISTEAGLDLAYAVESWLSLNYKLSSKRDPLLSEKAQVTQNFLLALTYAFDSRTAQ